MTWAVLAVPQTAEQGVSQPVSWYPEHTSRHLVGLSLLPQEAQLSVNPATKYKVTRNIV